MSPKHPEPISNAYCSFPWMPNMCIRFNVFKTKLWSLLSGGQSSPNQGFPVPINSPTMGLTSKSLEPSLLPFLLSYPLNNPLANLTVYFKEYSRFLYLTLTIIVQATIISGLDQGTFLLTVLRVFFVPRPIDAEGKHHLDQKLSSCGGLTA